ncbi:hypothetical protein OAC78_08245 [Litorivicinus sp.]|nr:hypothetical protein [Litorivicinus sp.]
MMTDDPSKKQLYALKEWTPLAEQGNATAQFNLGVMYATGRGDPQGDQPSVLISKLVFTTSVAGL